MSPRIYRVQLGASLEKSEVANKVPQIETKYGPVQVVFESPYWKIQIGQLDNYPDAHELKDDALANGFVGAFVVWDENVEGLLNIQPVLTGKGNRLGVAQLPAIQEAPAVPEDELMLNSSEFQSRIDFDTIVQELSAKIESLPNADPRKGFNLFWYALAKERTNKRTDVQTAFDTLINIVSGKVSAPGGYRQKALLQAVDILHYSDRQYAQAYRLYKLLLKSDWLTTTGKAEVQAELAGTLLEMMDSGNKGTPADVRHQLRQLYIQMPVDQHRARAVVELIYSETWFWEGDQGLAVAVEYSDYLTRKYSDLPQILCQAYWNKAVALERLGDLDQAKSVAMHAVNVYVAEDESFRTRVGVWDMEQRVSRLLVRLNSKMGDINSAEQWRQNLNRGEYQTQPLTVRVPGEGYE